jgi:hypothetical protein
MVAAALRKPGSVASFRQKITAEPKRRPCGHAQRLDGAESHFCLVRRAARCLTRWCLTQCRFPHCRRWCRSPGGERCRKRDRRSPRYLTSVCSHVCPAASTAHRLAPSVRSTNSSRIEGSRWDDRYLTPGNAAKNPLPSVPQNDRRRTQLTAHFHTRISRSPNRLKWLTLWPVSQDLRPGGPLARTRSAPRSPLRLLPDRVGQSRKRVTAPTPEDIKTLTSSATDTRRTTAFRARASPTG